MQETKKEPISPSLICGILSVITLGTVILGFYYKNPLIVIYGIVPAAIYEAIRTEGFFTKIASVAIGILVILEILALRGIITFDLAAKTGMENIYFSGYNIPLGNITFIFPTVALILSLILVYRTFGAYTKWLSVLLIISSAFLVYMVSKESMFEMLRYKSYWF